MVFLNLKSKSVTLQWLPCTLKFISKLLSGLTRPLSFFSQHCLCPPVLASLPLGYMLTPPPGISLWLVIIAANSSLWLLNDPLPDGYFEHFTQMGRGGGLSAERCELLGTQVLAFLFPGNLLSFFRTQPQTGFLKAASLGSMPRTGALPVCSLSPTEDFITFF